MGLGIAVGWLAEVIADNPDDPDCAVDMRKDFDAVNEVLRRHGLPNHKEPESLPPLDNRAWECSFGYSSIHYLRRAYAYFVKNPDDPIPDLPKENDASADPFIGDVSSPKHHLLWFSDAEGFYVPIDFETVIEDEQLYGGYLGSRVC